MMQDIIKPAKIAGFALGIAIVIGIVFWVFSEPEIKYFYVNNNNAYGVYLVCAQVRCGQNKIFYQTFNGREAIEVYKELNEALEKPRKIRN